MMCLNRIKDWIAVFSPLMTTIATVALVIVTICYVHLLYNQNALQQDPILKVNPGEPYIKGKSPGNIELTLHNTGISDISNICIFEDYFIPAQDNPLALYRLGMYTVKEDSKIKYLKRGERTTFRMRFDHLLDEMTKFLKDKKGDQYRIVRIKIIFNRDLDKKEFKTIKFYVIAGDGEMLMTEDERGTISFGIIPFEEIRRILDN